ncbi:NADH-quinone oxidoreductase subunit N [Compostibacter hankyongensis]|uniref:NADH-quinone oxidoreductase subunit N n=1 Tax=Compostibacter hankyongensis TaxID=1007089 RepID=A0ABP8FGJ7_9BACT
MNALVFTAVFGIVMMLSGLFIKNKSVISSLAVAGIAVAFVLNLLDFACYGTEATDLYNHMLSVNRFSILFNAVALGCTLVYFLLSGRAFAAVGEYVGEYFGLIFFILCGVTLTSSYGNLLMLFLAIEIISIPQYILAGSDKRNLKSSEASLKYFLMGSFSTGVLLLGIAFIYGAAGSFDIRQLNLAENGNILSLTGVILIAFALAFKVSAAPFHFWTPDVYDGAPTVFTSFISTVVKAAGFVAFIRLFHISFSAAPVSAHWITVLSVITAATLVIGNVTAVFQQSVKRMLAYSSIAQAGFMLFAVIAFNDLAWQGILLYAAAYSLATIGCFAVLLKLKDYTYDGYNGLARQQPLLALLTAVFLFSLVGIPATAGFLAKYFMLSAAVQSGGLLWLVILAVCCAAISAFYYFRVIWAMYFKPANEGETAMAQEATPGFKGMLLLTALLVIALGVFPGLILNWL